MSLASHRGPIPEEVDGEDATSRRRADLQQWLCHTRRDDNHYDCHIVRLEVFAAASVSARTPLSARNAFHGLDQHGAARLGLLQSADHNVQIAEVGNRVVVVGDADAGGEPAGANGKRAVGLYNLAPVVGDQFIDTVAGDLKSVTFIAVVRPRKPFSQGEAAFRRLNVGTEILRCFRDLGAHPHLHTRIAAVGTS